MCIACRCSVRYRSSYMQVYVHVRLSYFVGSSSVIFTTQQHVHPRRRDTENKMSATFLAVLSLLLVHTFCSYARFTDTGVPCYLRPSGDRCHYRAKPDSPTCTSADDRRRLAEGARQLNRSIAVLEQKLIRLGVSKY